MGSSSMEMEWAAGVSCLSKGVYDRILMHDRRAPWQRELDIGPYKEIIQRDMGVGKL